MHSKDETKTFKYLKWTKYAAWLYFFFCFISCMLLIIHEYVYTLYNSWRFFNIATSTIILWIMNPMVLIISIIGLVTYLKERRDATKKEQIGKKWISFFGWNVLTVILWRVSIICFVHITGGV